MPSYNTTDNSSFEDSFVMIGDLNENCRELLFQGPSFNSFEIIQTLKTALQILGDENERELRNTRITIAARNLIYMLTGTTILNPTSASPLRHVGRSTAADRDWSPPKESRAQKHKFSPSSARHILEMVDANKTFKSIIAKYPKYTRSRLAEIRRQVAGESIEGQLESIDSYTYQRVVEARKSLLIVRGFMIQTWASQHARLIGADNFKATGFWLRAFKKRHSIGSRKIGKKTTRAKEVDTAAKERSKFAFLDKFERQRIRFHDGLIVNFDQSGFEYELSTERTLSFIGERDTIAIVDQANKASHSYTIQPIISRDGRTIGKLLICLQETGGRFGPKVVKEVEELVRRFKNIEVIASQSGKMSAALMRDWVERNLVPPLKKIADRRPPPAEYEPQPGCSWMDAGCPASVPPEEDDCYQSDAACPRKVKPVALVLGDSWGGNTNREVLDHLSSNGVQFLQIPPGTTDDLQPCDLEFFRQYKFIVRRITMQAHYDGTMREISSRAGVLNVQSLVYNQLGSPAYRDLIRYSWRSVDRTFSTHELTTRDGPDRAGSIQFSFSAGSKCEQEGCERFAFIRCSYCSRKLCLEHFLDRVCFHDFADDEDRDEIELDAEDLDE